MSDLSKTTAEETTGTFTVTLYATKGGKKVKIQSAAKTWAELKKEVSNQGFDVAKLHATESIHKANLANDAAEVPQQDFVLFLTPKETKSGADRAPEGIKYADLKALVKSDIAENGEHAKAHYGNYTQLSSANMRTLANSYVAPAPAGAALSEKKPKANVADVVESVAKAKEVTNADRLATAEENLRAICANASEEVCERIEAVLEEFPGILAELGETASTATAAPAKEDTSAADAEAARVAQEQADAKAKADEEAREQKRLDDEETARLAKEAKSLGFSA